MTLTGGRKTQVHFNIKGYIFSVRRWGKIILTVRNVNYTNVMSTCPVCVLHYAEYMKYEYFNYFWLSQNMLNEQVHPVARREIQLPWQTGKWQHETLIYWCIKLSYKNLKHTVKPPIRDHPVCHEKVVSRERWSLCRGLYLKYERPSCTKDKIC